MKEFGEDGFIISDNIRYPGMTYPDIYNTEAFTSWPRSTVHRIYRNQATYAGGTDVRDLYGW